MKIPIFVYLVVFTISLHNQSCSSGELELSGLKQAGTKIHLVENQNEKSVQPDLLIYDINEDRSELIKFSVKVNGAFEKTNEHIISTFLSHCSLLEKGHSVELLNLEEKGETVLIKLSNPKHILNPRDIELFTKALELTLIRNSTNSRFNIQYS